MINRLFVYGTLIPGGPNEHVLQQIGGSFETGSVKGTLHPEGWGATMGYPAIKLDERGNEVQGFLFTSENLSEHWAQLDEFEGDAYQRVLTKVKLKDNRTVDAYVYTIR